MTAENLYNLNNLLAFGSVIAYLLSLLPGIIRTLFPSLRSKAWSRWLLKNRKEMGLAAFFLSLVHGGMVVWYRELNLLDPEILLAASSGIAMTLIFTLLAITSNRWSIKNLRKNWWKLHRLTYLVILILPWHIWVKVDEWTVFTPISLVLLGIMIPVLVYKIIVSWSSKA